MNHMGAWTFPVNNFRIKNWMPQTSRFKRGIVCYWFKKYLKCFSFSSYSVMPQYVLYWWCHVYYRTQLKHGPVCWQSMMVWKKSQTLLGQNSSSFTILAKQYWSFGKVFDIEGMNKQEAGSRGLLSRKQDLVSEEWEDGMTCFTLG